MDQSYTPASDNIQWTQEQHVFYRRFLVLLDIAAFVLSMSALTMSIIASAFDDQRIILASSIIQASVLGIDQYRMSTRRRIKTHGTNMLQLDRLDAQML